MYSKSILLICLLSLLSPATAFTREIVQVFVSIPPQQYFVERIGGELVDVKVMLKAGDSPETFDPGLKQVSDLNDADLYFQIGVAFEKKWLNTIKNKDIKVVACCDDILKTRSISFDNHIWTSARNAKLLAASIKRELTQIDPEHAFHYEQNYSKLVQELERLDKEIHADLNNRRTDFFIISHAALAHYAEDYGLTQLALEYEGKELGARSLVAIVERARKEQIQTLFVQTQHRSAIAAAFADEIDARVIEFDPLDGDYINNMRDITKKIVEAVR
jgi:zinc transport system substrate-binding protein